MVLARAIRVHETGGPDKLVEEDVEIGAAGPGEVIVKQSAIGVNFIDTYMRTGLYPANLPLTLGLEGAGVIESVGEGVTAVKPGDRVAYNGVPGCYATHVKGAADRMVKIPDRVSDEDAAALMLKGLTAWMLLFEIRRVMPGDTLLVWAAAGGVGSILVPWAKTLGAKVIGVVSTPEKAELATANGCDHVLLSSEDIPARVRELTGGAGVDSVLDSVGKDSAEASMKSLRPRGLWITYGNASGPADPVAPGKLSQYGSLMMTRPTLFHFTTTRADLERGCQALFGALKVGAIQSQVNHRLPLSSASKAHADLEARLTTGATILYPDLDGLSG